MGMIKGAPLHTGYVPQPQALRDKRESKTTRESQEGYSIILFFNFV